MNKVFNIIIAGVGGQGLITLNNLIANAAFYDGYDVKTSELHGLSQRVGSVETHLKFGKKIYSPLVVAGKADLVLGLETTEGLRAIRFFNPKTIFVVNDNYISFLENISKEEVEKKIKSSIGSNLRLVSASEICKKELGKEVVSSIYLLGYCVFKKIIPLNSESVLRAIEETIPEKYLELNKKAFELAKKHD
ncbi:MAG: indolepyruvate oxidoreductase subunit beta [Patescibacteria group bacterium]